MWFSLPFSRASSSSHNTHTHKQTHAYTDTHTDSHTHPNTIPGPCMSPLFSSLKCHTRLLVKAHEAPLSPLLHGDSLKLPGRGVSISLLRAMVLLLVLLLHHHSPPFPLVSLWSSLWSGFSYFSAVVVIVVCAYSNLHWGDVHAYIRHTYTRRTAQKTRHRHTKQSAGMEGELPALTGWPCVCQQSVMDTEPLLLSNSTIPQGLRGSSSGGNSGAPAGRHV